MKGIMKVMYLDSRGGLDLRGVFKGVWEDQRITTHAEIL